MTNIYTRISKQIEAYHWNTYMLNQKDWTPFFQLTYNFVPSRMKINQHVLQSIGNNCYHVINKSCKHYL